MEIKIDLPSWKCDDILKIHEFVTEDVTAYYGSSNTPYGDSNAHNDELKPISIKIAYPRCCRPQELENEFPMLHVLNDFAYDKVVNNLFNDMLWQKIVK